MSYSCNTAGFPRIHSYDAARKHFDSVKPWQSKYNRGGEERPIGQRAVKHNDDYQFNKAMRELGDGSIAFRLFNTDCVIWHPNGELTVHGYASMSTTAFVNSLTPGGVIHRQGRKDDDEPVLQLTQVIEHVSPATEWWLESKWRGPDWDGGMIIRCDRPVRLRHCSKKTWRPINVDALQPFYVPQIDHRAARQASRRYNLPLLDKVLDAIMALNAPPPPVTISSWAPGSVRLGDIMDALERGEYMEAIALFPRGPGKRSFGRSYGTGDGILPGFLRQLRDHIYDHEGVISRVERTMLTPAQYKRYIRDTNRFY